MKTAFDPSRGAKARERARLFAELDQAVAEYRRLAAIGGGCRAAGTEVKKAIDALDSQIYGLNFTTDH